VHLFEAIKNILRDLVRHAVVVVAVENGAKSSITWFSVAAVENGANLVSNPWFSAVLGCHKSLPKEILTRRH
jgi:hypothetical protein